MLSEKPDKKQSRIYPVSLKNEAVAMLEEGHSAKSIADRLGLPRTNLIYKWRDRMKQLSGETNQEAQSIEELKAELSRVQRERDILKKALAILGRNEP